MVQTILTVAGLLAAVVIYYVMQKKQSELQDRLIDQAEEFEEEKIRIRKDAKMRSSAVNWGKSIEHFAPFMTDFPLPVEDVVFLGMPIDFVGFTDTGNAKKCTVHFVEVKSGNSFLSTKQKNIKKAIQEGRVEWHELAVESNRAV